MVFSFREHRSPAHLALSIFYFQGNGQFKISKDYLNFKSCEAILAENKNMKQGVSRIGSLDSNCAHFANFTMITKHRSIVSFVHLENRE